MSGSVTLPGNSVSTAPGEIIVVRMLYGLTSWRNPSASARTACFVAAYTAKSGPILWPATNETKIMCPDFCFFICSRAAAIPYNTPLMLTSIVRSQSSRVRRSSGARGLIPALLIMTSIRPNSCTAVSTNFFTWLRWVTSVATATAFPPLRFNSSANDLRRSERRAPSATLAPCAERSRAAASPSPLLAPVMTTIFPSMLLLIVKLNRDSHRAGDVQRSDARIYLSDDDYAGLGNFLAALAIVNGYVVRGRPISQVSNLVSVRSFPLLRDCYRQAGIFLSAEQVVHRERQGQQRNEIPGGFIVGESGGKNPIVDA